MDPSREIGLLARWRSYIEGRGLPIEPSAGGGGGARSGRPDYVDEHHEELHAALRAHQVLACLRAQGPAGARQAALLEATYLTCDKEGRRTTLDSAGLGVRQGQPRHDEHELAGLLTAKPKERERRRRVTGLDREGLRNRGRRLLDAAREAYEEVRRALLRAA